MFNIRLAIPEDSEGIFSLIQELAAFEKLEQQVTGSSTQLREHLFSNRPYAEVFVAEQEQTLIGYALFFTTYSSFRSQPGLYLEDVFVRPDYRRQGVGTALIAQVAQQVEQRGYGRLEWSVLDWNHRAISFYEQLGATVLPDWRICRVSDRPLKKLAQQVLESETKS
ncbi:GNAT family N-acetyltransferase [Geitlerinema sp. P-1104]|uniref:GNAT family N-acetyltransferase n=1 Tax=Geitlerinema sp. P-1104 TaxID=2546230 RepID=UPI001476ABCA|nr:GNAT family N-acetyltransferase [Geitlerinema sp. P-1104]NMG59252.1 GNAT family N-acetyltransferase [Geitlerinema sp. P-1104]